MKIPLATLAERAFIEDGKVNILGVFSNLAVSSLPATFSASLILVVDLQLEEVGQEHGLRIQCKDADGSLCFEVGASFEGSFTSLPRPDQKSPVNLIVPLQSLTLFKYGRYSIRISINEDVERTVSFAVVPL